MSVFTVHLVKTNVVTSLKMLWNPFRPGRVGGLIHAENMVSMTLGSHVLSPKRILLRKLVVFAQWENEVSIDNFLINNKMGKKLAKGWHIRLAFLRQWGHLDEFQIPEEDTEPVDPEAPVVAVTLARLKLLQVPRFIKWGRPVEKLVKDHPGVTLALAATRPPHTVSTFSIWSTQNDMIGMVHGRSNVSQPTRHIDAMKERDRKDFHTQFTTLRFKPLSEHGEWEKCTSFIPNVKGRN